MAVAVKNYYSVLEIDRGATDDEVKRAFRRLARQFHPDLNDTDPMAEARFKQVNEAYDVLSDAEKRRDYDEFGDNWRHADELRKGSGFRFNDVRQASMDPRNLFNFFGGRGGFGEPAPQNVDVEINLEEAFHGCTRLLTLGGAEGRSRSLEVDIPAGISDGGKVRLNPSGMAPIELTVSVAAHHRFKRAGDDLHVDVAVPLLDAILGGEVLVQTLDGRLMLKIPPDTQNGESIRLSGKGMRKLRSDERGDLFAKVMVVLPADLTTEQKELYERLRGLERS